MATNREQLNQELAALDDEAFVWIAMALRRSAMLHGANIQIWPDGLGGFRDRERMERIRALADAYVEE